jgi:hypothetical protein
VLWVSAAGLISTVEFDESSKLRTVLHVVAKVADSPQGPSGKGSRSHGAPTLVSEHAARSQTTHSVKVEAIRNEIGALELNLKPQASYREQRARTPNERDGQIVISPHMQGVLLWRRPNTRVRQADNCVARLADIGAFVRVPAAGGSPGLIVVVGRWGALTLGMKEAR